MKIGDLVRVTVGSHKGRILEVMQVDGSFIYTRRDGHHSWFKLDEIERYIHTPPHDALNDKEVKGKLRLGLLPVLAIEKIAEVFEHGASVYPAWNWMQDDEWHETYYEAILRHLFAWRKGETHDAKSGKSHLAHVAANAIIMLTRQETEK